MPARSSTPRRLWLAGVGLLSTAALLAGATTLPTAQAVDTAGEADSVVPGFLGGDQGLDDLDNRTGKVAPSSAARSRVDALGAEAQWNQFGTPSSLIKFRGYLATGLGSNPVKAARTFIANNRVLFRLSTTGVNNLELLNDSRMADSRGHAVLFRQAFGDLRTAQDGLITVGVVDGKVAYASSSAVGDGNRPAAASLAPVDAWKRAADSIGVATTGISNFRKDNSWTVFSVDGLSQPQRSRLVALPTPTEGVRPAYETIVHDARTSDAHGHPFAYTIFVDAVDGKIWYRTNRVNHLDAGQLAPALAPTAGAFTGRYEPPACGSMHPIQVDADIRSIYVAASAAPVPQDIILNLYDPSGTLAASSDIPVGDNPEVIQYSPGGELAVGEWNAEVCPFNPQEQGPSDYAGSFFTSEQGVSTFPFPPRWKYFLQNPPLSGSNTDTRIVGCFTRADGQTAGGTLPAGCDREEGNVAARQPWDVDGYTSVPTFTTRGNAALSSEAWLNFRGPGPFGQMPTSPQREYIYPWTDQWRDEKCAPTVFTTPQRNDIDAATTSLFANHNRMHDWSYFLGFTENNYNMQFNNFGNTAPDRQNDPELGQSQAGAIQGGFPSFTGRDNANQTTLNDGIPGITNMYLWQPLPGAFYASCTDGDYDMSVIGHEYTHAISNRMVAGPDQGLSSSLDGQARAMGESFSDLTAVEYLNEYDYVPVANENPFAVGPYVTGAREAGIRNYGMNNSPLNFSDVQGYDGSGSGSPHDDGEIWSAVNFDIRQALNRRYNGSFPAGNEALQKRCAAGILPADKCPGNRRWMQMVFDAYLLISNGNATMIDARNAALAADRMRYGGTAPGPDNQKLLWEQFARRGFGQFASTTGTDDPQPIPSFESPLQTNEATWRFRYVNENGGMVESTQTYVGDYEGRITPVFDTDPATPLDDTAKFVPGTYDFVVQAPGYGLTRFTRTFEANQDRRNRLLLLTNWASANNGATAVGDGANFRNLIDDTEATNYVSGPPGSSSDGDATTREVPGRQVTVDLARGRHKVDVVKVSALLRSNAPDACDQGDECDPQDLSQNRFSALRQFAVEVCTAAAGNQQCGNRSTVAAAGDGWERIFRSAEDAFPGAVPRPLSPQLIFREFDVPDRRATHVRMVVLDNQCTGNNQYHGDQDNDPQVNSDCRTDGLIAAPDEAILAPQDRTVRAAEFQVFSAGGEGGGGSGTPQDPFVAFTKTGPLTADQGQTITYTLDYANLGPAPSEQAKITDQLPKGLAFVSATGPDRYNTSTRTVRWNLGTVDVLEDGSVKLTVRVGSGVETGAVLTNLAEFSGALTTATPAVAATLVL